MKNIWQENNEFEELPALTDKMVKQAEKQLKVKLPKTYIQLLKQQNGGYILFNAYPTTAPTSWAEDHVQVDHLLGIDKGQGILQSEYLIKEWGLPKDLVLLSGDGHAWIAFDYRNSEENPPIIYVDPDAEKVIELAPDFDAFLDGLYVEDREIEDTDTDFDDEMKEWTLEEIEEAIASTNEYEVQLGLEYIHQHTKGNEQFLEQKLIQLLQSPSLDLRQVAANLAYHFNEAGTLSTEAVKTMVAIIRTDEEIEYYADMYFNGY